MRYLSGEAYGDSASGVIADGNANFGFNTVTLLGAQIYISPIQTAPPVSTNIFFTDNDVMMQGFYWDVPLGGTWYDNIRTQAVDMATNGFTSIWFPPPQKCDVGGISVGYDPFDHYDLGDYFQKGTTETLYGNRAELQRAINSFRSSGMQPYVDLVLNHMVGGNNLQYTNYPHKLFLKSASDFYAGQSNLVFEPFHRQINFGDEVNQHQPNMRKGLEGWIDWLSTLVGFQGYRVDHSQGIEPWFQAEMLRRPFTEGNFCVLEYNAHLDPLELQTWIELTDRRACLFDFALRDKLYQMCGTGSFDISQMFKAGLAGVAPQYAVTFVENHDTIRPCFSANDLGIQTNKNLAYAYILISEGEPTVFYHDYYELPNAVAITNHDAQCFGGKNDAFTGAPLKPQIDRLIKARQGYAAGPTTNLVSQSSTNKQDLYIVKRTGEGSKDGCILAINRAFSSRSETVSTLWPTNAVLFDFTDTNSPPHSVTNNASSQATLTIPARSYRVYVRQP
jgi:alpha-amylase